MCCKYFHYTLTYLKLLISRTIIPNWNDKIVFNEKYKHIITESSVILFELVDFTGSTQPPVTSNDWHRLAWAFIRPVRSNGVTNTGKQMRLQLYKPGRRSKSFHKNQPMVLTVICKTIQYYINYSNGKNFNRYIIVFDFNL